LDGQQHPALVTPADLSDWSAHTRPGCRHTIQPPGIGARFAHALEHQSRSV